MNNYDITIGLEIHAELSSKSKVFCGCEQSFGGEQNTRCCPRCSALPGTLPLFNQTAAKYAVMAGIALNCDINLSSAFDRKNYFYPDLPKAYQISQFFFPICTDGYVDVSQKRIRINRIHIEEDAGKLIHDSMQGISKADYNRCGVPLIEIVTEPDITSIEEAKAFVEEVASRLRYAGVCDAKMEEGSLRCDVNISIKPVGCKILGTRAEIKNLNSIKSIGRAIEYEIKRQASVLESGKKVVQETRRFNDSNGKTTSMRSKEEAHDYRYFPEPDIPTLVFTQEEIDEIAKCLPIMPEVRKKIYIEEYKLPEADADLLLNKKYYSDFYNKVVEINKNYKAIASLIVVEVFRLINDKGFDDEFKFSCEQFAKLIKMLDEGLITKAAQKSILAIMFESGEDPEKIAKENDLIISNDTDAVEKAVDEVINENQKAVGEFKDGSGKVIGFLMGQVIRKIGKSSSPAVIKEIIIKKLNS